MDHFFFLYSPVDGHFGYFQVLAMLNIDAVQYCQPVSLGFWSSQGLGPAVGLLDHMVVQFLAFNAPPFCSHYWLLPVYIHQQLEGTRISKAPSGFIVCRLFTDGILSVAW